MRSGTVQATIGLLETWSDACSISVKRVYEWLRPRAHLRPCFQTIWHPICEPKHLFMVWLAALERLPMKDRLRMGDGDGSCVLCRATMESHAHLFVNG